MLFLDEKFWKKAARGVELFIAVLTMVAVFWYGLLSVQVLAGMDWTLTSTFHEFVSRTLFAIIGIEIVRMLLYHSIGSVLELLAFVIARKMLHPELTSPDLMFNTVAFVLLMAARHFLMEKKFYE